MSGQERCRFYGRLQVCLFACQQDPPPDALLTRLCDFGNKHEPGKLLLVGSSLQKSDALLHAPMQWRRWDVPCQHMLKIP